MSNIISNKIPCQVTHVMTHVIGLLALITSKLSSLNSWNLKDKADLKRASLIGPWQGWVLLNQEAANKKPVKL